MRSLLMTYLSEIRSTIVSVGISRLMTRSTSITSSSAFACSKVLGKPSNNNDPPSSNTLEVSSLTNRIIKSSGTKFPESMYVFASFPMVVSSWTCRRNTSPVDKWRNSGKSFKILFEIVPFPPPVIQVPKIDELSLSHFMLSDWWYHVTIEELLTRFSQNECQYSILLTINFCPRRKHAFGKSGILLRSIQPWS